MLSEVINNTTYQQFLEEHRLMGTKCRSCGQLFLPPRPLCPGCHGVDMEWIELNGKGRLIAFTTVHIAPTAMINAGYGRDNPYCVGVVEVEEGPAISAQIVGVESANPQEITIGTPLKASFVRRGQDGERKTFLVFEVK